MSIHYTNYSSHFKYKICLNIICLTFFWRWTVSFKAAVHCAERLWSVLYLKHRALWAHDKLRTEFRQCAATFRRSFIHFCMWCTCPLHVIRYFTPDAYVTCSWRWTGPKFPWSLHQEQLFSVVWSFGCVVLSTLALAVTATAAASPVLLEWLLKDARIHRVYGCVHRRRWFSMHIATACQIMQWGETAIVVYCYWYLVLH